LALLASACNAQEWSEPVRLGVTERSAASSAAKSTFEMVWDCDMEITRAGMRGEVALDIAVQDFGVVTLPVLAKVYRTNDTSAIHGEAGCVELGGACDASSSASGSCAIFRIAATGQRFSSKSSKTSKLLVAAVILADS
jgi:hypothetical protein